MDLDGFSRFSRQVGAKQRVVAWFCTLERQRPSFIRPSLRNITSIVGKISAHGAKVRFGLISASEAGLGGLLGPLLHAL